MLDPKALRVIGEGKEIEIRTVASEIAGVGRRVCALASHEGQREEKSIPGVGAVNVEIPEEDLFRGRDPARECLVRTPLRRASPLDYRLRPGLSADQVREVLILSTSRENGEQDR
jgi:hypothetical protein